MANLSDLDLRNAREHVAAALRLLDRIIIDRAGDGRSDPFPPDLPPRGGQLRGDWDALPGDGG